MSEFRIGWRGLSRPATMVWLGCLMLASSGGRATPSVQRVELPPQQTHTIRLLANEDHRRIPLRLIGNYAFLEGAVDGRGGGFILDTGTPQSVFMNNAYVPLALDHYVTTGKAGSALGAPGRQQHVYAHGDVAELQIADRLYKAPGTLFSSDFGYIGDMANGGVRPDFLGFVGLPTLIDHEFVMDYAQGTLDLYRLDGSGNSRIAHVQPEEVFATLAFHREADQSSHLPFVDIEIDGTQFSALLDNGTLGELALTPETQARLEAKQLLRKSPPGWHICGATYQGVALRIDVPRIRQSQTNMLSLGHNLLKHYRSVWNYQKQTVTLLNTAKPAPCGLD